MKVFMPMPYNVTMDIFPLCMSADGKTGQIQVV